MSEVSIFLPGLTEFNLSHLDESQFCGCKQLARILRYSQKIQYQKDFVETLMQIFICEDSPEPSIAHITAFYDNLIIKEPYCLRADPVELRADLAAVYMYGNQHFKLNQRQTNKIKQQLESLFNEYALTLYTHESQRWYLGFNKKPALTAKQPMMLQGKDIADHLPQGTAPCHFQKLQTEVQMLLHELPEIQPVNSLWFWGAGEVLDNIQFSPRDFQLISDNVIALGFAKSSRKSYETVDFFAEDFSLKLLDKDSLIVLDAFNQTTDEDQFFKALIQLENKIFNPVLKSLKQGKISQLKLNFFNGIQYQLSPYSHYAFWKKPLSVAKELCKKPLFEEKN